MNLLAETEWKIGDKCYAIFSEDELYYPAIITKVQFLKRLLWSLYFTFMAFYQVLTLYSR